MTTPCLSLIIPTRERADTLASTLVTALEQRSDDYEVIVSDNASIDDTRAVVERFDDPRLRYFNSGKRLSMCDNYEFALQQARGDYVIVIGDDDAVVPGAIDHLLSLLRQSDEQLIHMWPLHIYDWPDAGGDGRIAYLAPVMASSELDLKAKARFAMAHGGWKYYELPSPYHAAIPRRMLDIIRSRTGRVFHSTQPDVFTAMAIAAIADRAINVGVTITFNGRSKRSNGIGFTTSKGQSNIDRFLREYSDYHLHPSLFPGVAGSANMIPDAVLLARDLFPELYGKTTFSYEAMWAYSCRHRFVSHLEVISNRRAIRQRHPFKTGRFFLFSFIHEASVVRRKILNWLTPTKQLDQDARTSILHFARALSARPGSPTGRYEHVAHH